MSVRPICYHSSAPLVLHIQTKSARTPDLRRMPMRHNSSGFRSSVLNLDLGRTQFFLSRFRDASQRVSAHWSGANSMFVKVIFCFTVERLLPTCSARPGPLE